MFCPKCGAENSNIAKFCYKCGNSFLVDDDACSKETLAPSGKDALIEQSDKKLDFYKNKGNFSYGQNSSNSSKKTVADTFIDNNIDLTGDKKNNTKKRLLVLLIIGLSATVIAVIICIVFFVVIKPPEDYNKALNECKSARSSLEKKVDEAKNTSNTSTNEVSDPNTINELKHEISDAENILNTVTINNELPDRQDMAEQTQILINNKETYNEESKQLSIDINNVSNSKDNKTNEAANLVSRYKDQAKDSKGYEIEGELKSTSWLKASDTKAINSAWKKAGGKGDAPSLTSINSNTKNNKGAYNDTAAVLICAVTFQNKTNSFHISSSNKYNPKMYLGFSEGDISPVSSSAQQYEAVIGYYTKTSGDSYSYCTYNTTKPGSISNEHPVSADMDSDNWGPVPVMIVASDVFSPNEPNGRSGIFESEMTCNLNLSSLSSGDVNHRSSFKIPTGW